MEPIVECDVDGARTSFEPTTPLVVRGAASSWLAAAPWTRDWFAETSGDTTIKIRAFFEGETVPSCGFDATVREYAAYLHTGDGSAFRERVAGLSGAVGRDVSTAAFNCGSIPVGELDPSCAEGIDLTVLPDLGTSVLDDTIVHYWIGTAGSSIGLHRDGYFGWLVQLRGRKLATLLAPDQRRWLALPAWNAIYSPVDVHDETMERHPRFRHASCHRATLEPGDALYIPCWWFHELRSLDDDTTSVNVWFRNEGVVIDAG